ncbi:peptidoglycan-binding protein [Burkholderia sp. LMG 13014]|uniref:peptidoglycan-binding domain-containing protein n=1 Tax=Burkholderia sp. LMG 13014 TaxID=2709306 RepID=UPI001965F052|nr:peptidoglycan-binding domain-containing protein [Burkholderia sp. LMG 13014]
MTNYFILRGVCLAVLASGLSACAPIISGAMNATVDENSLKTKTADYFHATPENVDISHVEKGALSTAYNARYAGAYYKCTVYYGQVDCKQTDAASAGNAQDVPASHARNEDPNMTTLQAQIRLNQLGFSIGQPDGVFGKKSVKELKLFQKSRGLPETGKLDPRTVDALRQG